MHGASGRCDQNVAVFVSATRAADVGLAEAVDSSMGQPAGITGVASHIGPRLDHPEGKAGAGKGVAAAIIAEQGINARCSLRKAAGGEDERDEQR